MCVNMYVSRCMIIIYGALSVEHCRYYDVYSSSFRYFVFVSRSPEYTLIAPNGKLVGEEIILAYRQKNVG